MVQLRSDASFFYESVDEAGVAIDDFAAIMVLLRDLPIYIRN